MSTTPSRHAVILGLFVAFAILILVAGIMTIGRINDTFTKKIYVTTVFSDVNGLKKGDNIWFSGLKVGIVKSLSFQTGAAVRVEMRIDQDASPFIHKDTLAKLGSDGLIGNRIIVLYGGTPESPPLAEGDVMTATESLSTDEIMKTLQTNNTNLLAITGNLKDLTGKIAAGEGTAGKLLTDEALYASLKKTSADLEVASANAQRLTGSLSTFAGGLNQPGHLPHDLVADQTTYPAITAAVGHFQTAGDRASTLMDGLAQGAADPNTPIGALAGDREAGADLKQTLDHLNRGSVLLNEDLEALQHNFLLRGFFRRKNGGGCGHCKAKTTSTDGATDAAPTQDTEGTP